MLYSVVYVVIICLSVCLSITSRCFTVMVKCQVKQHSAQWHFKSYWRIARPLTTFARGRHCYAGRLQARFCHTFK